jgi:hypothetical protein
MECLAVAKLPEGSRWIYEIKLDGYRAIGVKTSREAIPDRQRHTKRSTEKCGCQIGNSAPVSDDAFSVIRSLLRK